MNGTFLTVPNLFPLILSLSKDVRKMSCQPTPSPNISCSIASAISIIFLLPALLLAQARALKAVRVPTALGGSTGFFWAAQRSGSFKKFGLKVLPIFMRGVADGMDFYRDKTRGRD
jgi:hypothetical protein